MEADATLLWLILASLGLVLFGFPIAHALGLCALGYLLIANFPLTIAVHQMAFSVNSFTMLAIPLFMFAGKLMTASGIADRLFDFAEHAVGRIPGGLGHVNVVSSLTFSGMSGSALADVAGLGEMEYKAMTRKGYDANFTIGITMASSAIGPMIPPSLPMVLYGVAANVSITGLFLGGIVPGFVIAASLMAYVLFVGLRRNYYTTEWAGLRALGISFLRAVPPLLTPVIIVGGMTAGIFSPTEAATAAVLYGLFISVAVYRELSWPAFVLVVKETTVTTARLMFIIAAALLFGWTLTIGQIPQTLSAFLADTIHEPALFLLVVIVIMLILGALMDNAILILVLAPMLAPIAETQYGIDPIHFGVLMVFNVLIGQFTPPLGLALYVMRDITGFSVGRVSWAVAPFLIPLIASLLLMAYVPGIVLGIPRALGF